MNIRCPSCQTLFRVDPARIPPSGVRARCARCANTFTITAELAHSQAHAMATAPGVSAPMAAPSAPAPMAPAAMASAAPAAPSMAPPQQSSPVAAPSFAPPQQRPPAGPSAPAPARPGAPIAAPPRPAPAPPPPAAVQAPPVSAATPASAATPPSAATTGTARAPVFGSRDPNARAQRIARALVSDIVAYHGKRRDAFLAAGTLRTEFRDEIMKSWEEYVAQVGLDMAKSTPYFRDALNAILANGQNLF